MANETEKKVVVLWSLTDDSNMAKAIATVADKAMRYRKEEHSFQYWTEFFLARGAQSFNDYLDNDKERRDKELFNKEVARLVAPNPTDATAMQAYATQIIGLQRKYGIGGEQKAL